MRRKPNRLKIALWFVFKSNLNMQTMDCGKCGGVNIEPVEETERDETGLHQEVDDMIIRRRYRHAYKCLDCGAVCAETQLWIW